jgi:phospholipase D1/2
VGTLITANPQHIYCMPEDSFNMKKGQILVPGKNCWKLEQAENVSFIVDAEAYFKAFRESLKLARTNIFICGWDIDSRTILLRDDPEDGYPIELGDFLNAVVERQAGVHIFLLIWDFVRFMGIDREWFPHLKFGWNAHENIHFCLDSNHPIGASQHHKLVVIDDALAFAGGLDLTRKRWDTPGHQPDDQRRTTRDGNWYRPHHDIQMMVSGRPAKSLGTYFRDRWASAAQDIRPKPASREFNGGRWPSAIDVHVHDCAVGIARTRAAYKELAGIREIEQLYLDSIDQAKSSIYIENQYLTSLIIVRALAASLQRENGPEIVIVLPYATDGWLSQNTMDVLRSRSIRVLREADGKQRLGMYYAYQEGLEGDDTIKIHSKLMIIDDRFVRIGSSNLNNRSMGFDTECDLALEADALAADASAAIRHLRNRLLGEHLDVAADDVESAVQKSGSLLRAIKELQGKSRSLKILEGQSSGTTGFVVEEQELFDPERPIDPETFLQRWLPVGQLKKGRFRFIQLVVLLLVFLGVAAAWRFGPLQEFMTAARLEEMVNFLQDSGFARLYVLGAYVLGSLLMVPITILITLTILVFGIFDGFVFAVLGAVLSSIITYWIGRLLGRDFVRSLAGNKLTSLSRKIGRRGILSTFIVRLMPIAPYSVVNVVAGASHIRFFDFIIGTVLGLLPGILAIIGLVDRGTALLTNPDFSTVASAFGVIAAILSGLFFIQKKFGEKPEVRIWINSI